MTRVLLTGGAGFIGSHVADALLAIGTHVTAVDNFDPFYSRTTKLHNLKGAQLQPNFKLIEADIRDASRFGEVVQGQYDAVVHLAAKAGISPSVSDAVGYVETNCKGTVNLLEFARDRGIPQFVFASSSSVYAPGADLPWCEDTCPAEPINPYAATKLAGEVFGRVYAQLYGFRFIALRLFSVYGSRQRPDLVIHRFASAMSAGEQLWVLGGGETARDFTFAGDVVRGICAALQYRATNFEVINLGSGRMITLNEVIATLEVAMNTKARVETRAARACDLPRTCADITKAQRLLGFSPFTSFEQGVNDFVQWRYGGDSRVWGCPSVPANGHENLFGPA
jgi:UDP-glucuronate 4-epimerase